MPIFRLFFAGFDLYKSLVLISLSILFVSGCYRETSGVGTPCVVHSDCPSGEQCVREQCQVVSGDSDAGDTDTDSDAGDGGDNGGGDSLPQSCTTNIECGAGEICDGDVCITGTGGGQCAFNSHCTSEEICVDGACVTGTAGGSCAGEVDCEANEDCVSGYCEQSCTVNSECGDGRICESSYCTAGTNGGSCTDNSHCAAEEICDAGMCITGTSGGACTDTAQCRGGQVCAVDICKTACAINPDCAGGEICSAGYCETGSEGGTCTINPHCAATEICDGGSCVGGESGGTCTVDGDCHTGERCHEGSCIIDLGVCTSSDGCSGDSFCHGNGYCLGYDYPGVDPNDVTCASNIDLASTSLEIQCAWSGPPGGDAYPDRVHSLGTPAVVDFDFDDDAQTIKPSIAFITFPTTGSYNTFGVVRIVDGETCEQLATFGEGADAPGFRATSSLAVGDIDGDGRADVVGTAFGGGVLAYRYNSGSGQFEKMWRSGVCDGGGGRVDDTPYSTTWAGPSIHDLDDDGVAEIIMGGVVYDNTGCVLDNSVVPSYSWGIIPVIADVDEDGAMEMVTGEMVYEWSASGWVAESYVTGGSLTVGQVGLADFGDYPVAALGGSDYVEIVVVRSGTVRVQTLDGTIVFGPVSVPGTGGGAPTVADFDNDGRPEIGTAGATDYVVFDLDCQAGADISVCPTLSTDYILWQTPSQDASSKVTGSSVFDFDADGKAEVVYADECFLRIYDGSDGSVLASVSRSSGTAFENPVVVDADGDYHAEVVYTLASYWDAGCPANDPLSTSTSFTFTQGLQVLRNTNDSWAASRQIWNQHAYAITHVGDQGQTIKSSEVALNWRTPGLNNFRQNTQGDLVSLGIGDLTATVTQGQVQCNGGGDVSLEATVCNRGTLPLAAGHAIKFAEGTADGLVLCTAVTAGTLAEGTCTTVGCDATLSAPSTPADVWVVADPDDALLECYEGNNNAVLSAVTCP